MENGVPQIDPVPRTEACLGLSNLHYELESKMTFPSHPWHGFHTTKREGRSDGWETYR